MSQPAPTSPTSLGAYVEAEAAAVHEGYLRLWDDGRGYDANALADFGAMVEQAERKIKAAQQAAASCPAPVTRPTLRPVVVRSRAREGNSTRRATARAGPDDDPHPPPPPRGRSHDLTWSAA